MTYRPPSLPALGHAIRDARLDRGLTQLELAATIGLNRAHLGHVEQGRRNATYRTLASIATALGVPLQEILTRADAHEAAHGTAAEPPRAR
ncbi:MAG TPA: helix-turn-helix transcriptional regulator [Solirubrobacteraceae bacterium]|nr:helix-turn-helix transcriptional regulator [Solirubrobacteraceae bacterium]